MKILISSKVLSDNLDKINFEDEYVIQVRGEGSKFIINTNSQTIEICCEILRFSPRVKQNNRRWDWVANLVDKVDEQPIVLDIYENVINVVFQY